MKKEHKIVLELVKYGNKDLDILSELIIDKTINWIEVLGHLCYHRVGGIAYEILNQINVRKIDFPVFFTLYMLYESQGTRTRFLKKQIGIISAKLCEADIKHVFLKGAILSNILYTDGSRASNDIDILVSKESIFQAQKVLNKLGLIQGKYDFKNNIIHKASQHELDESIQTRGEMFPFVKIINESTVKTLDIDVNFSLDWKPSAPRDNVDYFLDQRISIPLDNETLVYSLSHEHMFIHLCSHLYKDAILIDIITKRKVLDLYKFADIYAFIQKYRGTLDMDKLHTDSVKFGFEKHTYYTVKYTSIIFPDLLNIPEVVSILEKIPDFNTNMMNEIFDQYNQNHKMIDNGDLIDRLFSYNIINKYINTNIE
jgi:hypothetical protein